MSAGEQAPAATLTWSDSGADWSTPSNWGGSLPGPGDTALFNAASYAFQPSLSSTASLGGVWDTGGGALAIGGNALTLLGTTINGNPGAGIELDSGGGPLTINAPLVLQNDQQWINNSASPLTVNGDISGAGGLTKLGSGILTLTGMNALGGDLNVGAGAIRMPSGSLSICSQYVGSGGTGAFIQSGGTNSAWDVQLGINPGDSGSYCLSGSGQLSASIEYIANSGNGCFMQSGETNAVAAGLFVGNSSYSGSYSLSGSGLLSATTEQIGSSDSTFRQTGGTNTAAYVDIGSGYYLLGAGLLQVSGGLHTADGTLDGGGGSAAIAAGSGSIVDLTGIVNAASMSLSVSGNSLLIVPAGFDPTRLPSYSNLGLTHTSGTTLNVSAGTGFGGWGTITDPVNCQGSITASPSGWINLTNGLTLSGTGQVNLGSGTLTVNDPNSNISGGALLADTLAVGLAGTGSFAQSGGAATLASNLFLGYGLGDSGTYDLGGSGQLFSGNSYVGCAGTGSFAQSGGTHAVSSALCTLDTTPAAAGPIVSAAAACSPRPRNSSATTGPGPSHSRAEPTWSPPVCPFTAELIPFVATVRFPQPARASAATPSKAASRSRAGPTLRTVFPLGPSGAAEAISFAAAACSR
jgi:autotransporter-associated beta strand protein